MKDTIRLIAGIGTLAACGLALLTPLYAQTEDFQVLGPILTWHGDPTSEVTITWLELGDEAVAAAGVTAEAKWREGKSGFGYGDDDDVTQIDMRGKHSTLYTRIAFDLSEKPTGDNAKLQIPEE